MPDTITDANGVKQANDPDADPDGDGLPTEYERGLGLNPIERYSTKLDETYGGEGYADDQEAVVRMAENGVFGPRNGDWADDGLNHGTVPNQSLGQRTRILDANKVFVRWTTGGV